MEKDATAEAAGGTCRTNLIAARKHCWRNVGHTPKSSHDTLTPCKPSNPVALQPLTFRKPLKSELAQLNLSFPILRIFSDFRIVC